MAEALSEGTWKAISASKIAALQASIPQEWRIPKQILPPESQDDVTQWLESSGLCSVEELAITSATASDLVKKMASGELTSLAVTTAFCKRAAMAHQLTNCLSETCFERALTTAKSRDEHLQRTGKTVGALHGLPISLKDNFNLKGLDSTLGFTGFANEPALGDATAVQIFEEAGAVFYVKTNVPTSMMMAESVNYTFGRTVNPRNRKTTSGGSSGGESALLVLRGSPLGVGTDIGGSLRIPSACTGIYALRPSSARFPNRDTRDGLPGQEAVVSVNGPMANTLADLSLYAKTIVDAEPWLRDPKCIPIPWRNVTLPARPKIAVLWHDLVVRPTPPVTRALREYVARLRSAGCEVVDWDPKDQGRIGRLLWPMFTADGGKYIRSVLKRTGEPWHPKMKHYENGNDITASQLWQMQLERNSYQRLIMDRWNAAGIDAILSPTIAFPTARNGEFAYPGYTGVWNILDSSAMNMPTPFKVDKSLDNPDPNYEAFSPLCEQINSQYDVDLLQGLPISLQLIGRRLEEEKILAMAEYVNRCVGKTDS